ncbi:nose resistant to fluoxetine protein 6-like [Pieris rapae]|uniref:nose resistant to fluoxetine protein 6-like n=1 Tax=Pieris rapae TaxID=64459 RepID=UPI001E27B3A6|nr:nose resistant to fluoxetine protein 6-like [Pieris rapae]
MQCSLFFLLALCVGSFASKTELNATLLEWFPPFFSLDDWGSCQRPMDKYCIVDAVLHSSKPSPLLDVLEVYSSEIYKHYNRTQIHRGVCVSRCPGKNNTDNLVEAAQSCIDENIKAYDLEAEVVSAKWCNTAGVSRVSQSARVMAVVMVTVLVIIVAATIVSFVDPKMGNKYLMAFSLKKNWEILTHSRSVPKSEPRLNCFAGFDGIKVLGIQSVFFTHIILIHAYAYSDNPEFIERFYDQFPWKVLMNSPLLLQAFFVMTGFMTAYMALIVSEKRKITILGCFYSIANRWFRLAPVVIFVLWFTMAWFPLMGSGPHWSWVVEKEAQECSEIWWYYLFFAQNLIGTERFCLSHLWYVGADMQFHIVGMLLLLVLVRYRKMALPVLLPLFIAPGIASAIVNWINEFPPIIAGQPPEVLRTLFSDWPRMTIIYLAPWMNPGFFAGLATGFIHYSNEEKGIKLNEKKWFCTLSHISLHLCMVVSVIGVIFMADDLPPLWATAVYSALDRNLIALFMSIMILGFASNCPSVLLKICSWRGFRVLGKLSYCAYIIHFIILRLIMGSNTNLVHVSIFSMICFVILTTILTYLACVPVYLIVELPMIQLWKAIFESPRPSPPVEPITVKMEQANNGHAEV